MDMKQAQADAELLPDVTAARIIESLTSGELPPQVAKRMGLPVQVLYFFMKKDPRYTAHQEMLEEIQADAMAARAMESADMTADDAISVKKQEQRIKARQWHLERTAAKFSPKKEIKGDLTVSHASLFDV